MSIQLETRRDPSGTLPKFTLCKCETHGVVFHRGKKLVHTLTWEAVSKVDGSLQPGSELLLIETVHADGEKARKSYLFTCPASGLKGFLVQISIYRPEAEISKMSEEALLKEKASYSNKQNRIHHWRLFMALMYLVGFCTFCGFAYRWHFKEEWTTIDFIYFAFATMLTVGYGDVYPTSTGSRMFTIFFVLAGTGIVMIFVRTLVSWLLNYQEELAYVLVKKLVYKTEVQTSVTGNKITVERSRLPGSESRNKAKFRFHEWRRRYKCFTTLACLLPDCLFGFWKANWPIFWALFQIACTLSLGCIVGNMEGWTFEQGLYFGAVTVTSVGYGDFSPKTQGGRLFCIFYMPIGVYLTMNALGQIVMFTILNHLKSEKASMEIMMELDLNKDECVSLEEFQLYMMKKLGRVDDRLLSMLELQYNKFNQTGHGLAGKRYNELEKERELARKQRNDKRLELVPPRLKLQFKAAEIKSAAAVMKKMVI